MSRRSLGLFAIVMAALGGEIPAAVAQETAPVTQSLKPATEAAAEPGKPFGRHGSLDEREMAMAKAAWQYFVTAYQEKTGLVNSVGSYPSTTLWDTASYISALVSARELGLIDKREFDSRALKLISTLRDLDLFRGELPNKVYNTQTAAKVDYANKPGEVGFSALDIGRLLVWMRILKERYPYLANGIDNALLRWNYCHVVDKDGELHGSLVDAKGQTKYVQEGRLGYEEYAAKGFELWGFQTKQSSRPQPLAFIDIYGVQVPYDGRDPRVFGTKNYVLTEGYLLDGLEMNWDLPNDRTSPDDVASQGWRMEFASRVYLAQQRRFEATGILTARSEHQVEGSPFFVYDAVFADGYAWNTLDPSGVYQPDRAAISAKAALGMWVLWDTPYTQLLFESVADLYTPEGGFYEGVYENGNGTIPLQTANNNGIILAGLLYKVQGPILKYLNNNAQFWDTAFENMTTRETRCLPVPQPPPPCNCEVETPPPVKSDDFQICKPVAGRNEFGARDCLIPASVAAVAEPLVPVCAAPKGPDEAQERTP